MPVQLMLESMSLARDGLGTLLLAAGFLVRLRPEFARGYPHIPADRWLPAHRRVGDEGFVWIDSQAAPGGGSELPVFETHVEIREPAS
jgi:hypothetical protein